MTPLKADAELLRMRLDELAEYAAQGAEHREQVVQEQLRRLDKRIAQILNKQD